MHVVPVDKVIHRFDVHRKAHARTVVMSIMVLASERYPRQQPYLQPTEKFVLDTDIDTAMSRSVDPYLLQSTPHIEFAVRFHRTKIMQVNAFAPHPVVDSVNSSYSNTYLVARMAVAGGVTMMVMMAMVVMVVRFPGG